jgi:UDP-N-acetylmuramoyl-L-alanyl-D-glutamate--2,6-diaminopimelate ligase
VNVDDKNGTVMLQNTKAKKLHYALRSPADFKAKIIENQLSGLVLNLDETEFYSRLIGRFNAYNLLAVYGVASLLEEDKIETLGVLSNLQSVEGRFQYLKTPAGPTTIVDYAHTPDALENVLETISAIKQVNSRLITVVGCGGDRDKAKRPIMASIASSMSDELILTSDNPRTENPDAILKDMQNGLDESQLNNAFVISGRKEAIKLAIKLASADDVVLIAGKGHEKYQEINGVRHDFDDYKIASDYTNQMKN